MEEIKEDKDLKEKLPLFFTNWNQIYVFMMLVLVALIVYFSYLTNKYQWL
jgi:hypothetical protein